MQPPTPCGKERVTSYHVHTTNDDPSNGKTTTWTQQTSEASGTYTFAGNEIDTDSEIKKTSILQGFVEARYVKITPITSTGIEKAQYHYKGKGQCSHNQNEGVVAGITQTSEVPDDTTCTNPRYHRLSNSLFECAEAITQDSACGSEFTYAKGGPRRLWCGCVSQGSTCNHASGSNLIQNRHGICLDANPRNTNGGTVHMYACNPAYKNQQWSYDESTGLIKNLDGICLDANPRKTNGGTVKMYQCEAHNPNQQWDYNKITGQIKNRDGICLDASERNTNRGQVHMWGCDTANENQQWNIPSSIGIMGDFCVARGQVTWRSHPSFTAHVKQAIPGLDMVGEENWYRVPQPKYQHSLLSGGAGYIQIGFWRIGDVDGENFAIGRKDVAGSVVVFTNSGYGTRGSTSFNEYTTYGKMYSLGQRKLLDAPTGIKIGNGFIEFSKKWRLYLTTTKEVLLLVHRSRGVSAAWQNTMTHIQFGVKPSETDSTVTGGVSWLASEGIKAWEQSTANCDVGRCVTFGTKHGNEFIQIGPAIICTYSKRSLSSFSPLLFFLFEWMK